MRIAAAVLILLVGLWSLVGGGCSAMAGCAAGKISAAGGEMAKGLNEMAKAADPNFKPDDKAMAELNKATSSLKNMMPAGIIVLIGGLLCIVAGIMFFMNKGKMLGLIAAGVGILGEILFFILVTFNVGGVIKILILGFCAFAATKLGQPEPGKPAAA